MPCLIHKKRLSNQCINLIFFFIIKGNTEQHQLTLICQLCGSIVPDVWPEVEKLELYTKMELPRGQKRKVKGLFFSYFEEST